MRFEIGAGSLSLRPIEKAEAAALHRLWTEEGVRRFLWDGEIVPFQQTEEILNKSLRLFKERGFGIWGVREEGRLVGFAGYWHFRSESSLELFFGVASDYWNRGIATQAGRSLIKYGFETLGFDRIVASTDAGNSASIRVLQKLGMSLRERVVVEGLDTVFYDLRRDAWRDASAS